jgi:hypothetical protein
LAASWQRWGNPLVDSGRELNVPLRLLQGQMLYSDIGYIYGPFSPYLNAALYRTFQPSLWMIWSRGIVATVLILGLIYWIARQLAGRYPATVSCLAVTWVCALKSQGNYMLAYAEGGLDGCLLVLMTVALLLVYFRKEQWGWLAAAGLCAGLAGLAKTELGGAALGAGLVAAIAAGFPKIRAVLLNATVFVAPGAGLPLLTYSWFANKVGWHSLIVENHLFFGHVPWQLLYFNGLRFGFDRPWHSIGLMLASLVRLIAAGGVLMAVGRLTSRSSDGEAASRMRAAMLLVASLIVAIVSGFGLADIGPFIPMPVLLLALVLLSGGAFLRAARAGDAQARVAAGSALLVSAGAMLCLARIVLRVSTGGALSSFLLPLSVVLFVFLWLELFPLIAEDETAQKHCRALAGGVLVIAIAATAVTVSLRYGRKFSFPIESARGTWRTTPELGAAFSQAKILVEKETAAGDPIAIFPEGTALAFLTGRSNPVREEIVTPGFLDEAGEARAVAALRDSRARLVFIANRNTAEFGQAAFGKDYDQTLMRWVEANYDVCGVFGTKPDPELQIGAPVFFLRAYCRKP